MRARSAEGPRRSPPTRPRELALHRAVLSQARTWRFRSRSAKSCAWARATATAARSTTSPKPRSRMSTSRRFRDRIITTLSGGEQQRAHFARVLVQLACGEAAHGPGLLLLDEPTASLDLQASARPARGGRGAARARGVAVVAILHDLNLATLAADRIVVLDGGRVAAEGTPAETITDELLARVFKVTRAVGRARRRRACRSCCRTAARRCASARSSAPCRPRCDARAPCGRSASPRVSSRTCRDRCRPSRGAGPCRIRAPPDSPRPRSLCLRRP